MDDRVFRSIAKNRLQDHWGVSIGTAAVAALLGGLLTGASFLPDFDVSLEFLSRFDVVRRLADQFSLELGNFSVNFSGASFFRLATFLLGGVVQLGYAKFLLKQHDGKAFEFNDLFSEFDRFGIGFAQSFLRRLYIFLWGLLLIIPGIIAGYSYAMTPFILAEQPDLTASEAISLSKEMMDGHKGDLFVLDLSFLGWAILCTLTLNIGNLWLNPYQNAAYAAFYRELRQDWQHRTTAQN